MTQHSHSDEQFDELLAEYFDWTDRTCRSDVAEFVENNPRWNDHRLVDDLSNYVRDSNGIEQLATDTLSHWLALDSTDERPERPVVHSRPSLKLEDYELLEELGRGGMGVVYLARNLSLERFVCVKMILQGQLADSIQVDRFRAEAKAMAALRHPNIVAVFDVGSSDDQHYFVMEYIEGRTLAKLIADDQLSISDAIRIVREVAGAIHYAHEQGVLHRDLKPSNIIVDEEGRSHVTDFGLARRSDTTGKTSTGILAGTPSYMAPELSHGDRSANVACDVYGLGAVLYECITGQPPFQGVTPLDTLLQVRSSDPIRPSRIKRGLPNDLETICLKCLAKSPSDRYSTANHVAEELEAFARGEPIKARPINAVARTLRWCRRNPMPVALAATIVFAIGVIAVSQWQSSVAASASLNELTKTHEKLEGEQARNEVLIGQLRNERDQAALHLYLSRIRRINQAIAQGRTNEAEDLLLSMIPSPGAEDLRGWEWFYLNALTKQYAWSIPNPERGLQYAAKCGDSNAQLISLDRAVLRLWDLDSRTNLNTIPVDNSNGVIATSESGQHLAYALNDGRIAIGEYPFSGAFRILSSVSRNADVRCLAWHPKEDSFAAGISDGSIIITHLERPDPQHIFSGHTDGINAISWSADGRLIASASDDASVRIHDAHTNTPLGVVGRFSDWVNDVSFQKNNLAAVSESGEVRTWNVALKENGLFKQEITRRQFGRSSSNIRWNPSGSRVAICGSDQSILVLHAGSLDVAQRLIGHRGNVATLQWHDDSSLITSSSDDSIKFWNTAERDLLSEDETPVRSVVCNPTRPQIAWRNVRGDVTVWDDANNKLEADYIESAAGATAIDWHPDGELLGLSRVGTVLVYSVGSVTDPIHFDVDFTIWNIRFSPDGAFVAVSGDHGEVVVFRLSDRQEIARLSLDKGTVRSFCWLSNNLICAADTESVVRCWNVDRQVELAALRIDSTLITSLSTNRAGDRIAVTTQEGLIHDLTWLGKLRLRQVLKGHQGTSWDSAWLSDDSLASCGQDGTVRLWDVASGEEAFRINAHDRPVWSLDISPDQNTLVSASANGEVRKWRGKALNSQ